MYGVTPFGGASGEGTLFSFDPHGDGNPVLLHAFTGDDDGGGPSSPLVEDENGNFYGTTEGGAKGDGTIYTYTADGRFLTLFSFSDNSNDGRSPLGPIVEYSPGHFAGAQSLGGTGPNRSGNGVIYTFQVKTHPAPKPPTVSNIAYFDLGSQVTGESIQGGVAVGPNGMVYGTTYVGGTNDAGIVFSFDPSAGVIGTLHDFNTEEGAGPRGPLLFANGTLYGTTSGTFEGFSMINNGTIFSLDLDGQYHTLYRFDGDSNGSLPIGSLAFGTNGDLWATTENGGKYNGSGSVLDFTGGDDSPNHHFSFDAANDPGDGSGPEAGLTLGDDGVFYGMTVGGGKYGLGTIFSIDQITLHHVILHSFGKPLGS